MGTNTTMQHQFQVAKIAIMAEEIMDYADNLIGTDPASMKLSEYEDMLKVIALLESAQEIINPSE